MSILKQVGVQRNQTVSGNPVFELTCPHCGEKTVFLVQVANVQVGIGLVDKKTGKTEEKSVVSRVPGLKVRQVA